MSKRAVVCGAGGFVGTHLVRRLKTDGYWVRGVDVKRPEWTPTAADEFLLLDLRDQAFAELALYSPLGFDEVYQLAADMGGMGFIHSHEIDCLRNNALINLSVIHAASELRIPKYFFSSSVCVYRDMRGGEPELNEEQAYPARPDNEYGWEKLYAERVALAYLRNKGMRIRIARFQNCYGPEGIFYGGREKAPAALCRKAACARDGDTLEIWGDGRAVRNFIYVDDLIDGIRRLMDGDLCSPVNIGTDEYVTVRQLASEVIAASGKRLNVVCVPGPVGVESRNFSNALIRSLGWEPTFRLREGIRRTYAWVNGEVQALRRAGQPDNG